MQFELHGSRILVNVTLFGSDQHLLQGVAAGRRVAIISDSNVMPLYGLPFARRIGASEADCFTTPAGEASKSRAEWSRLTDAMLAAGFGRDSIIVSVGGGMVGDLAGFVAATYMRGIPFVQVPTTLLAMIDASVGGKTGIDTPAGKNLVGAFHHPVLVLIDPVTLKSLPQRQYRAGLAEALKHALITSTEQLEWLLASAPALADADLSAIEELLRRNVRIKADIVARDEREAGLRKTLNFGHTIGHAIESVSGYEMLHGECIAIGMLVEARIAVALGLANAALIERITLAAETLNLPTEIPAALATDAILSATKTDKKARGGAVEYALLSDVGRMASADAGYGTAVPDSIATEAVAATR